jgi:hypothetical protein
MPLLALCRTGCRGAGGAEDVEEVAPPAAEENPTLLTRRPTGDCSPASPAAALGLREVDAKPDLPIQDEPAEESAGVEPEETFGEQAAWHASASSSTELPTEGTRGGKQVREEVKAARAEQRELARQSVKPFLEQNGFASVKSARRRLMSSCYPLHVAVTANDVELIQRLLRAGADPFQCDSSGRTPLELAQRENRKSSHRKAMEVLKRSTRNGKHWVPWLRTPSGGLARGSSSGGPPRSGSQS